MANYVPRVSPCSKRDLEVHANGLITKYFPYLLSKPGEFPILDFFEHILPRDYSLDTGVELLSDGVEGITWPDGRVLVSEETYRAAARRNGRARFTIAHEACHGIRHRTQIKRALVDTGQLVLHRRADIECFRDPEWQANYFAGALLMPESMVRKLSAEEPRMFLPLTMTDIFGVSEKAAEVRLAKLGI
jgi:hypothetical protein